MLFPVHVRTALAPDRRPMTRLRLWGGVALLVFVALGSWARGADRELLAGVDDKWQHYRSPNFELYSRQAELESRRLLRDLELLRTVFIERFHIVERARLEVTIYYFRSVADFRAYGAEHTKKNDSFRGFYMAGPDRAMIAMAPTDNADGSRHLIFHEYIHHLVRADDKDAAVWYNEGLAEMFSSIREARDQLEIGQPQVWRLLALRGEKLMPLEQLFAVDHASPIYRSSNHSGLFYAQSWALMHYWHFGKSGFSAEAVARFLQVAGDRKAAAAADLPALFQECFGMDYAEMQRRLQRYVSTGSYQFARQPIPKVDPPTSYQVRQVPRHEIRTRLAELSLRTTQSPIAKLVLLEATEKNSKDPRPFEALGSHALREQDENEARRRWEQAIDAGSENVAIYRELGLMESRTWFSRFDYYFRLPVETAERLRSRLQRSITQDPQQTAGYEMLAWVEAFSDQPVIANINRVQEVFPRLRHRDRTLVALALVRIRAGKSEEGMKILEQLEEVNPEPWAAHAAEVIRARVEGRPVGQTQTWRKGEKAPVHVAPIGSAPRLKPPAIELPGQR